MSWQGEMVLILRHLIDDIDGATYSKSRLEESLLISAQLVRTQIDLPQTYTIDVDSLILSPDPTSDTRDEVFINLVCLKTACIILRNEAKVKGNEAVSMSDGPSSINTQARYKAAKEMADEACDNYEQAKIEYMTGSGSPGKAVVGPIVNANIHTMRGNI